MYEFFKIKGILVVGYKKNELVKIVEFIFNFKCFIDFDFIGDNIEKVIKERYKIVGCDVNFFKFIGFILDFFNILNFIFYDIFNYLFLYWVDYDKKKFKVFKSVEDYRLYYDGYVEYLECVCNG